MNWIPKLVFPATEKPNTNPQYGSLEQIESVSHDQPKLEYNRKNEFSYEITESGWIKMWFRDTKTELIFHLNQIKLIQSEIDKKTRKRMIRIQINSSQDPDQSLYLPNNLVKQCYNDIQSRLMGFQKAPVWMN